MTCPCPDASPRAAGLRRLTVVMLAVGVMASALVVGQSTSPRPVGDPPAKWWKGNLHTHSLWSDGDQYPELIALWYKEHGYQFLALSDHNVLSRGQKWVNASKNKGGPTALDKYRERFGASWVEEREGKAPPPKADEKAAEKAEKGEAAGPLREVRLKPIGEFRALVEEADRFLMLQGEEISDKLGKLPVHLCVTNLHDVIPPQGGATISELIANNVRAVRAQREQTGQPMFAHLNHPNWNFGVTAEDLAPVEDERFFEVYNGHRGVKNEGDAQHADTERLWDIILTLRLGELGLGPIYGVATDDSHEYHGAAEKVVASPGRGWVVVRARRLTPESLITAMEAGDFYASNGVELTDIRQVDGKLAIDIVPQPGVTYKTQFIGTRKGYDSKSEPVLDDKQQPLPVTRRYSADVGQVLAEVEGANPSYTLKGDELYVRAKVVSSKPKENYYRKGEFEMAWVQPIVLKGKE